MFTGQIISLVIGTTTPIGLIALLAYLYFTLHMRRVERSIREVVEGEGLFNADQVIRILEQFKDDASRLSALRALTNLDTKKTKEFLGRIENNVDISYLNRSSNALYTSLSRTTAILFLGLAIAGAVYRLVAPDPVPTNHVTPPAEHGTQEAMYAVENNFGCDSKGRDDVFCPMLILDYKVKNGLINVVADLRGIVISPSDPSFGIDPHRQGRVIIKCGDQVSSSPYLGRTDTLSANAKYKGTAFCQATVGDTVHLVVEANPRGGSVMNFGGDSTIRIVDKP